MTNMRIAVIFPTYNAETTLGPLLDSIQQQTLKPDNILAIDCSSFDKTIEILKTYNIPYHTIATADFNHGRTYAKAIEIVGLRNCCFI